MRHLRSVLPLVLLLTACSPALPGHGSVSLPPPPGSSTAAPSTPVVATPTPSDPTPTATPTGPGVICPSGAVTAAGAPFCYPLPAGFTDQSTLPGYASPWPWRTLVSVGGHDLIEVLGADYDIDTDTLSPSELRAFYAPRLERRSGELDVSSVSAARAVRRDGARGFVQHVRFRGGVRAVETALYRGRDVVLVSCQWAARPRAVNRACDHVLAGLVIAPG